MTDLKAALARLERDLDVAGAQLRAAQGRYDELKIACWGLRLAIDRYGPDAETEDYVVPGPGDDPGQG